MVLGPLATVDDITDVWRPLTDTEEDQAYNLIVKASAKLRQKCPFNIDARIALHATAPTAVLALDPRIVADVVATIVKRFLANVEGYASTSEGVGPYSRSGTFVNRYDKTGSDVRGAIQVIESDIDQLRPSVPARVPTSVQMVPTKAMRPPVGYLTEPYQQFGYGPFSIGQPSPFPAGAGSYITGDTADDVITDPSLTPNSYYQSNPAPSGVRAVTDSATVAAADEVWVRITAGQNITLVVLADVAGQSCIIRRLDTTAGTVAVAGLTGTISGQPSYPLPGGVSVRVASDGTNLTVTVL